MAKKNTKQGSDRPKQQFDERRDERGKLTDNTWHGGYISLSLSDRQKQSAPRGLAEREKKEERKKDGVQIFFFHPLPSTLAYKKLPLSPSQLRCNVAML